MFLLTFALLALSFSFVLAVDPCIPTPGGWQDLDDAPSINAAIVSCGARGTIIIPANSIFNIRSPIDFTPCQSCDFQIEGTVQVGHGNWGFWAKKDFFQFKGVKGARVRSVTGTGVVDGNAIEYYTQRFDSGMFEGTNAFFGFTDQSSEIRVENLVVKNVMHRFFRIIGNSTNIHLTNLTLSSVEQWGAYPRNEQDTVGIEIGEASNIDISAIDISFQAAQRTRGPVGVCIAFDRGARSITVRQITCTGAFGGVLVQMASIGWNYGTPSPVAVENIHVSDLDVDASLATGIVTYPAVTTLRNLTWENVYVRNGNPAPVELCWYKSHSFTPWFSTCRESVNMTVREVLFKGYRGKVQETPASGVSWPYTPYNNMTSVELRYEDWVPGTVE
ncbi:glycoside hydrolase family 28 protein [Sporormia fimetaria CBS 119925]|uniref:Glycoside hydrolase family 28 protein n=1 Tax=Sporormia fimetaria CBS 119925 TaxID=1340428 RepID=A0A6A6V2T6_9PLEO|nr:glycoside hydrolase family 28 protein [Sporormia fimetaria CBS 119925]